MTLREFVLAVSSAQPLAALGLRLIVLEVVELQDAAYPTQQKFY